MKKSSLNKLCISLLVPLLFLASCGKKLPYSQISDSTSESSDIRHEENDYKKLLAPSDVSYDADELQIKWSMVAGAKTYEINVNGKIIAKDIKKDSYKVSTDIIDPTTSNKYLISVRAISEDKKTKSNYKSFLYDNSKKVGSIFDYYLNDDNSSLTLSAVNKAYRSQITSSLIIPSAINGIPVTVIGENIFNGNKKLSSVTLPSSIVEIKNSAFSDSTLKEIILNENLKTIGEGAFTRCAQLSKITIPDSVLQIEKNAFLGCGALNEVIFTSNSSLTTISTEVFKNCSKLTSFVLPKTVTSLGEAIFENAGLTSFDFNNNQLINELPAKLFSGCKFTSFTIPGFITKLNDGVFQSCNSLKTLLIDDSSAFSEIPANFLYSCKLLKYFGKESAYDENKKAIIIPNSIKVINENAFAKISVNDVIFEEGSSLNEIKANAFIDNASITSIDFPSSLSLIGEEAFSGNSKLATINLANDNSLEIIGKDAFKSTPYLKAFASKRIVIGNVLYKGATKDINSRTLVIDDNIVSITNSAFKEAACETITLPKNLKYIGDNAFDGSNLKEISFPDSLISIGKEAFKESKQLKNVSFSEGSQLNEFGEGAFFGCYSLSSITIPNNVTSIPKDFLNMSMEKNPSNLKNVIFGNKVEIIGENAFSSCVALDNISLPDSVIEISTNAFLKTSSLSTFTISTNSKLQSIGESAFAESKINKIYLPKTLIELKTKSFQNCTSLKEVKFASLAFENANNKEIEECVFENCSSLKEIILPDCINTIKEYAFKDATSLLDIDTKANNIARNSFENTAFANSFKDGVVNYNGIMLQYVGNSKNVIIPKEVKIIGNSAFKDCSVETVHISASVEIIQESAFENCTSLKNIIVDGNSSSLTDIENSAFKNCVSLESISFSKNIQRIGEYAFFNCYKLDNVVLDSKNLTIIEKYSFANCNSLSNINLSLSINKIDEYAFYHCNLKEIVIPSAVSEINDYAFAYNGLADNVLVNPALWTITPSLRKVIYSENSKLNRIGKYAFASNIMDEITLPNNEIYLDEYCFMDSKNITTFNLKKEYTIAQGIIAFSNKLNKVYVSSTQSLLSALDGNVLDIPTSLKEVEIIDDSNEILANAFLGFGGVEKFIIPSTITKINANAFYGCHRIESIDISNVTYIGANAFMSCLNLSDITFSDNIEYIGNKALYATKYFSSLEKKEFVMVNNILIGYNGNKETVTLPENVVAVAGGAFSGNHTIKKIILSKNTNLLCNGAFDSCINLNEIDANYDGLVNIELEIFDTLSSNLKVKVKKDIVSLYDNDIYWSLYDNNIKTK